MSDETTDHGRDMSPDAGDISPFIWPLGKSVVPDEMNTSFGPRIDADRWDFHDGIDLPAPVGTPVHAMANGVVHRAGPADKTGTGQGFGSTHVLLQVRDPTDGQNDLFLVYLHLDSLEEGVIAGAPVQQGDVIGAVGQEDATYPHLHLEFRKGAPKEDNSVHPLRYLQYSNTPNFTQLRLDRCNFSRVGDDDRRTIRLRFEAPDRQEGDLQGVDVELSDDGVEPLKFHVDFDDRDTIKSDKGDEQAFTNGIAVEGYQKSNLKGDGLLELQYGVIVEDIFPTFKFVKLKVVDVEKGTTESPKLALPALEDGENPVNSRVGFESQTFPPRGWTVQLAPGNVCRRDAAAALTGSQGLLCQDFQGVPDTLIRAGLRFALPVNRSPVRPMSWRIRADIQPAEVQMSKGQVIHPLAFLNGDEMVAAACLRKIRNDELVAGVLIRSADGLFRERIDVNEEVFRDGPVRWELELLRVGTRQTTAVVRLNDIVVTRINGDTESVEPDAACVGILHRHSGLQITLHVDLLLLTEAPR